MNLIRLLQSSKLLKDNAIFIIGAVATGAINYALYPIIGRLVTVEAFGEIQVLFSILLQAGILFNVIRLFTITIVSNETHQERQIANFYGFQSFLIRTGIVLTILFAAAAPVLGSFLKFQSSLPFLPLAIAFMLSFPLVQYMGYVHAKQAFFDTSVVQTLQAGSKLILVVIAALLGISVTGIMGAVALSGAITLYWAIRTAKKHGLATNPAVKGHPFKISEYLKENGSHLFVTAIVAATTALHLSIDTILVKHFFSPEQAGLYAGIAVVARIIFFVISPVAGVLLPSITPTNSPRKNTHTYLYSMLLALFLGASVGSIFAVFPDSTLQILLGSAYTAQSGLLILGAIAVLCISISNIVLYYHLAMKDTKIALVSIAGMLILLLLVWHDQPTLYLFIRRYAIACTATTGLLLAWTTVWHLRERGVDGKK